MVLRNTSSKICSHKFAKECHLPRNSLIMSIDGNCLTKRDKSKSEISQKGAMRQQNVSVLLIFDVSSRTSRPV